MKIDKIKSAEIKYTIYFCDTCKKEFTDTSYGKLRECYMCGEDVCSECAIHTDSEYLQRGSYSGDYPDYYCPECWTKGKDIISEIHDLRLARDDEEALLWDEWKIKCKKGEKNEK